MTLQPWPTIRHPWEWTAHGRRMLIPPHGWPSRLEWLDRAGSTNDVVMGWLRDGTPEVCVAIADEQTAGRGRDGRSWTAPPGTGLLCSVGFRPTWLEPTAAWRLAAVISLAMASAAESIAQLAPGTIHLKWPNDLVAATEADGAILKLGGVLGETEALGSPDARAVIGVGINAGWPRADFPRDLAPTMTSLAELGPARRVDREALADAFLSQLGTLVAALRADRFPAGAWRGRQVTNGSPVVLEWPDGTSETVLAEDVDLETGALLVRARADGAARRSVVAGEIRHVRVGGAV